MNHNTLDVQKSSVIVRNNISHIFITNYIPSCDFGIYLTTFNKSKDKTSRKIEQKISYTVSNANNKSKEKTKTNDNIHLLWQRIIKKRK